MSLRRGRSEWMLRKRGIWCILRIVASGGHPVGLRDGPGSPPRPAREAIQCGNLLDQGTNMATEKQIEANRQNAQKSTGPKSDEGKEQSRANSLKHGLAG